MYDPAIARWHCVDPLVEKYNSQSSYHFSGNNPVRFIDFNGKNYDDYKLNQDGSIDLIRETDSQTDELYATNSDGTVNQDKKVSVEKGTFSESNELVTSNDNISGIKTDNQTDAKTVFKFAAENTSVEFGLINYTEGGVSKSIVLTNGEPNKVSASTVAKSIERRGAVITEVGHNHPRGTQPSGYNQRGTPLPGDPIGDRTNAVSYPNNSNGDPIKRFVYAPSNNAVFEYNAEGYTFMPSIFYFE